MGKKTATAVAYCKRGKGLIKVNGRPLELVQPTALSFKLQEPILLLGKDRFADIDIRIRVKGGGHTSQIYAIRQALSKSLVAYYQKYVDEQSKQEIKDIPSSMTGLCWWRIPEGTNQRSSVDREPAPDTRSLIVSVLIVLCLFLDIRLDLQKH